VVDDTAHRGESKSSKKPLMLADDEDWSPSYNIDSGHLLRCAAIIMSKGWNSL
jgi:hypothetical protein